MSAQSPEKIKEAQALLIAQGKYYGIADGLRGELTEAAMRARGEEIAGELERLGDREAGLAAGVVTAGLSAAAPQVDADGNRILSVAEQRADFEDRSRKASQAALWIEIMLWVLEGARSLGLWVYVTTITTKTANVPGREAEAEPDVEPVAATSEGEDFDVDPGTPEEIVALEPDQEASHDADELRAALIANDFLLAVSEYEPQPEIVPSGSRNGGLSTGLKNRAESNKPAIPVDDFFHAQTSEVAA